MKHLNAKKKAIERNITRKNNKQHFMKLIRLSNKRKINGLLKNSSSCKEFKESISKILKHESFPLNSDENKIEEWLKESEKIYTYNKIEEDIKRKLDTLNKLQEDVNSMENNCICKELTQVITEKYKQDTLSETDINKITNLYNSLIDEICHLDSF
jgi:uncharacterized protein YoxC